MWNWQKKPLTNITFTSETYRKHFAKQIVHFDKIFQPSKIASTRIIASVLEWPEWRNNWGLTVLENGTHTQVLRLRKYQCWLSLSLVHVCRFLDWKRNTYQLLEYWILLQEFSITLGLQCPLILLLQKGQKWCGQTL